MSQDWTAVETELLKFMDDCKEVLSPNQITGALHYFNVGEYEMAFEALIRTLYEKGLYPFNFDFEEWKQTALKFELDVLPSFGDEFWSAFLIWGEKFNDAE